MHADGFVVAEERSNTVSAGAFSSASFWRSGVLPSHARANGSLRAGKMMESRPVTDDDYRQALFFAEDLQSQKPAGNCPV